jgi:hypothetical protein
MLPACVHEDEPWWGRGEIESLPEPENCTNERGFLLSFLESAPEVAAELKSRLRLSSESRRGANPCLPSGGDTVMLKL